MKTVICKQCGIEFQSEVRRGNTRKFCSKKCFSEYNRKGRLLICPVCGIEFYRKPHYFKLVKGEWGLCCSSKCSKTIRSKMMTGENNHQFGLKGSKNSSYKEFINTKKNNTLLEDMIDVAPWYKRNSNNGRIAYHKYIVEKNYSKFPLSFFDKEDGWFYIKRGLVIHHKDCNHRNNLIENLQILTKAEHCRIHNLLNPRKRNSKGQFVKNK